MTIEERIKTHLSEAHNLDTDNRLEMARWQATHDVLSKLQQIKEDSAWLAGTLQDLAERIDRDGEKAVINSAGITGHLGDRINLGGAELAGLNARLQTLESLSRPAGKEA
jgi:hypothetical protein